MSINKNYCADKSIAIVGYGKIGQAFLKLSRTYCLFKQYIVIDSKPQPIEEQVGFFQFDINDNAIKDVIARVDIIVSCLPWKSHKILMEMALKASVPIFGVARIDYSGSERLEIMAKEGNSVVLNGCGLEPGLTEIFCNYLAKSYLSIDKIKVYCGGIPSSPTPPLGYRLTFDAKHLPFSKRVTYCIKEGQLTPVERFSDIESVNIAEIGMLESFNDGLLPWRLQFAKDYAVKEYTQKTLRWPGYAAVVNFLHDTGLLNDDKIEGKLSEFTYKQLIVTKLLPQLTAFEDERDVTILLIKIEGNNNKGVNTMKSLLLISQDNTVLNLSSMAIVTALPLLFMVEKYVKTQRPPLTSRPENYLCKDDIKRLIGVLKSFAIEITIK